VKPRPAGPLAIGGFEPFSTCDWPGMLVATVFCQGCPWDCLYCHNPALISPRAAGRVDWRDIRRLLAARRGLLDGVVFSGGEATRQDLGPAIREVRELGLAVGLHTSGAYPARLGGLLPLVDWVGFDVKSTPDDVTRLTRRPASGAAMAASLRLLLEAGVVHQVRTTWGPGVMSLAQAQAVQAWCRAQGVANPVLQPVRPEGANPAFQAAYHQAIAAAA
jgi:pyruvate formate lyase activating enzyme